MQEEFSSRLGCELEPVEQGYGFRATIRGKRYFFPSLTHVYDASRGNLSEYRIQDESEESNKEQG